jgi:hypothetical protein
MANFCEHCGAPLKVGVRFCEACGQPITPIVEQTSRLKSSSSSSPKPIRPAPSQKKNIPVYAPAAAQPPQYSYQPRRSANPAAIAAGIGTGVLVLVLLVLVVWRLTDRPSPKIIVKPPVERGQQKAPYRSGSPLAQVPSPPVKETPQRPQPVKTRFTKAKDGVISDSKTGLEWYVCPDRNISSDQAKGWTESLSVAGGGWRMPSISELKALYQRGAGPNNLDPIFQTTGSHVIVCSVERHAGANMHFAFSFEDGQKVLGDTGEEDRRAFAIRSRRPLPQPQAEPKTATGSFSLDEETLTSAPAKPSFTPPAPNVAPPPQATGSGRWPWTSGRLIQPDDLGPLSLLDLEFMRNEIYARHGWVFNRRDLRDYFGRQSWYQPKGSLFNREQVNRLAQAELNAIERKNIQIIVSRENFLKR